MSRPERPAGSRGAALALITVLIVAGIVLNVFTPPDLTFTPFFSAPALVAGAVLSARATAWTGGVCTAIVAVLLLADPEVDVDERIARIATVATLSALAVGVNVLLTRGRRQIAVARAVAGAVQSAVVPDPPPRVGPVLLAARYQAAQREALVGGDLYAAVDTPFGVRMVMGDVRGKGLGAMAAVAAVLGSFREAAQTEPALAGLADRMESALRRETAARSVVDAEEGFVTAVLAEVPAGDPGELRVHNRGHPAPLILDPDGSVRTVDPAEHALPLGLGGLGRAIGHGGGTESGVRSVTFPPGAIAVFYTDGVSEARDVRGTFYDPARGLRGGVFAGPGELLDALVGQVVRHTADGPDDDLAVLAAQRRA